MAWHARGQKVGSGCQEPSGGLDLSAGRRWQVELRGGATVLTDYDPIADRYEALERT